MSHVLRTVVASRSVPFAHAGAGRRRRDEPRIRIELARRRTGGAGSTPR